MMGGAGADEAGKSKGDKGKGAPLGGPRPGFGGGGTGGVKAGLCLRWRIWGWLLASMVLMSRGESFIGNLWESFRKAWWQIASS